MKRLVDDPFILGFSLAIMIGLLAVGLATRPIEAQAPSQVPTSPSSVHAVRPPEAPTGVRIVSPKEFVISLPPGEKFVGLGVASLGCYSFVATKRLPGEAPRELILYVQRTEPAEHLDTLCRFQER